MNLLNQELNLLTNDSLFHDVPSWEQEYELRDSFYDDETPEISISGTLQNLSDGSGKRRRRRTKSKFS